MPIDARDKWREALAAFAVAVTTVMAGHALGIVQPFDASAAARVPSQPVRPAPDTMPAAHYSHYVALGDSFTSGPSIPRVRNDPRGCARSTRNYPSILAERLGVRRFTDVSCGGAGTAHLTAPQRTAQGTNPPQTNALSPDTDLVTLTIGGNDEGVISGLIETCMTLRGKDPTGAPCAANFTSAGLDEIEPRIDRTEGKVERALREIHRRAPGAEVALIGYPRLTPSQGYCPETLPFTYRDYAYVDGVEQTLNAALLRAARRADATYVDTYEPSLGHDICAGNRAWVNGKIPRPLAAAAFHPFNAGMRGMAVAVETRLRR